MLTAQRLRELLHYDPLTGVFTRLVRTSNSVQVGDRAGSQMSKGYRQVSVDGENHYEHRLAWLHYYGVWPQGEIDHRDRVRHHNWIENLRDATGTQNQGNQVELRSNNSTGFKGVSYHKKTRRYRAIITKRGKQVALGYFETPEQASKAYQAAALKYFGEFKS